MPSDLSGGVLTGRGSLQGRAGHTASEVLSSLLFPFSNASIFHGFLFGNINNSLFRIVKTFICEVLVKQSQ